MSTFFGVIIFNFSGVVFPMWFFVISKLRRGQVSAEMLVLTAAIIAIAFILITQLESTAVKSANMLSNKTDAILAGINSLEG